MISKLTKQAAEEADQKAFCDEELGESKAKQGTLNGKLDKNSARIEKAEAGKAKLTEEIQTLEAEIAEIDAGNAEATKIRQEEHAEFEKSSSDFKASAEAVAKAIQVLEQYYSKGSFIQMSMHTRRLGQPSFGGANADASTGIVGLLEVAESDFTRLLAEAQADEDNAKSTYDTL